LDTQITTERLTKRNLWTYTLASIGRDTATLLWSGYLITFVIFTRTLSDSQFAVLNAIMIAARIFDAFNDPVMGNILEVTRTKWGKFKPWIFIGMVFSAMVYLVSFSNTLDGWAYVALFGVMYFVYSIVFTMNDIAFWGMLPSLANQKSDRDKLTSRAVFFAGVGGAIASIVVPTFTAGDMTIGGNAVSAYRMIAVIFTICFIGFQMIALLGVKEKPLPPKGESTVNKVGLGTIFRTIRNNDQLSWAIIFFLFNTTGSGILNNGLGINYIFFEFGYNGMLFTVFSALGAVAAAVVMVFFTPISRRFTRDQLMKLSVWSIAGGYLAILLVGLVVPSGAMWLKFGLMMVGNLFAFAGQSVAYLVIMICIANAVEYNEWKTGARAEGIIFSVRPFVTKLGWAIIQFIVMIVFLATGVRTYTNQIADLENAASRGLGKEAKTEGIKRVLASVPADKSTALLVCMTIIPIVFALASYAVYKRKYTITEEKYDRILAELEERKALVGGKIPPLEERND